MKTRWSSTAALSLLFAVLVALLATLQWRWLYEIEAREHYMRQRHVGYASWLFKRTFEWEIDELASRLASAAGPRDERPGSLADALDRWRASARWPGMVGAVYVAEPADGEGAILSRLESPPGDAEPVLVPIPWPSSLRPFAAASPAPPERQVLASALAIAVPWPGVAGVRVIAVLDEKHLATRAFPDLVERFMPRPSFQTTEVAVAETGSDRVLYTTGEVERASEFGRFDIQYGLVAWGDVPGAEPGTGGRTGPPSVLGATSPAEPQWFDELHDLLYNRGHWRVLVRYSDVPIPAEVARTKARKAAAGFGLLALLVTSLGMLTFATRRTQRAARQQLEQLARVSHELRTPLTVLSSAGDNLADAIVSGDDEVRGYGRLIQRETRRLHDMVENVLRLARRRSGVAAPEPHPVDVVALVEDVLATARPGLDEAGFTVERSLPAHAVEVVGDRQALRSALLNLVSNALKYGRSGRWLRIAIAERGRHVRIEITDRGPGIDPREAERIFEPYVRGSRAGPVEGSGLGLAVVHDVARAHGGRVAVERASEGGALFVLHLPRAHGPGRGGEGGG